MNIFVLHLNPHIAAQMHCDQHVIKMIIESAQLLYTCIILNGIIGDKYHDRITTAPITKSGTYGYKATHQNHPCAVWVQESVENYEWLYIMAKELCYEYTRRYKKVHATEEHIDWLGYVCPNISSRGLTDFARVMPDEYIDNTSNSYKQEYIVESYRNYYKSKTFATWKMNKPDWY